MVEGQFPGRLWRSASKGSVASRSLTRYLALRSTAQRRKEFGKIPRTGAVTLNEFGGLYIVYATMTTGTAGWSTEHCRFSGPP